MKKLTMVLAVALILPSCSTDGDGDIYARLNEPKDSMQQTTISFDLNGSITQQPMTRASLAESQMTDLWLFDYMGDVLQTTIHQSSEDDGFGGITLTADYGYHTFYFIASRGDTPTIDGTTISWLKPSDTFCASKAITIEPETTGTQSITLHRVVTRLRIAVTDEVPANLKTISVTPTVWYCGLDYRTTEPTAISTSPRTVNVPSSYIGTTGYLALNIYGFCPSDGFETDITVSASDADAAEIASVSLSDVPLLRNRITSYSGSLFSEAKSLSFETDDEWGDDYEHTW